MCKCNTLKDVYEGVRVEGVPELSSLKEVGTDYKKWETVYECRECGQRWLEKYIAKGGGRVDVPEVRKI